VKDFSPLPFSNEFFHFNPVRGSLSGIVDEDPASVWYRASRLHVGVIENGEKVS
jgi:hypothetical protein